MALLGTFTMQPADEWDYDIYYGEWLTDSDGFSEHVSPTVTITPDTLTLEKVVKDYENKIIKIWLSGGSDGVRYKVEVTVRTREGRTRQDEFFVIVRDL